MGSGIGIAPVAEGIHGPIKYFGEVRFTDAAAKGDGDSKLSALTAKFVDHAVNVANRRVRLMPGPAAVRTDYSRVAVAIRHFAAVTRARNAGSVPVYELSAS